MAFVVKVEQRARCHGNQMVVLSTEEDLARLAVMGPRTPMKQLMNRGLATRRFVGSGCAELE